MGVYAETSIEVICENAESARKVKRAIVKAKEESKEKDEYNYGYSELSLVEGDSSVYLDKSSERVQNLSYQCEQLWELVKGIEGVDEMTCPFMVESDGEYFSNEDEDNK